MNMPVTMIASKRGYCLLNAFAKSKDGADIYFLYAVKYKLKIQYNRYLYQGS